MPLRSTHSIDALQAIKEGQRAADAVGVAESCYIGVGVGGRVDTTTKVHSTTHRAIYRGEERCNGLSVIGLAVIECKVLFTHRHGILDGIAHTIVKR